MYITSYEFHLFIRRDLDEGTDLSIAALEIVLDTVQDQHGAKQRKNSVLKTKASEFLSALGRSPSILRHGGGESSGAASMAGGLPQTGLLRIPLALLMNTGVRGNEAAMQIGGKYIVKDFYNQNLGEITLHLVPTKGAIKVGSAEAKERSLVHQSYLSYESSGEWARHWALLQKDLLIFRDVKKRSNATDEVRVNLSQVVKIYFSPGHGKLDDMGMEDSIILEWEDGAQLYLYADSNEEAAAWADALSVAIWNTPHDPSSSS